MIDFEKIKAIITEASKQAGVDKYEIYYKSTKDTDTHALKDEINNFSSGVFGGLCFRCISNGRMGYASTALMDDEEIRSLVSRALNNAKYIENEDEKFIFGGSPSYGKTTAKPMQLPDAALMKKNVLELQKNTYAQSDSVTDGTKSQIFAFETETHIFNSEGLDLYNKAAMCGGTTLAVIKENGEPAESGEFALGCELDNLLPISAEAVRKAKRKLGAGELESGKYDLIIDGRQMRSLLATFSSVFSGKSARLGLSLLAGKENTAIASECVTISDDPFDPNCPVQTPFDAEGVAVYKKNIVENGMLKTLLYDLTNAKKAGVQSTGNASKGGYSASVGISPYRFGIEPGKYSLDELFETVGNGVYITEIKGLHAGANSTTGDFSIESAGFVINDGKEGKPVKSFTIAGNFYSLLKSISHIGNKVEYGVPGGYTVFASPAVLVRNISIAGK